MSTYKNDPRLLITRYESVCMTCGCKIPKGKQAYYWPRLKDVYCLPCGEQDYLDFLSSAADEEVYNGSGNPFAN
ncbi:MAG: hypothetical protein K0B15_11900 [Lentimicrobium sp.]|nr:hypothetical protein [Lentimicrobium sp.]